ncbi:MAG TPA: ABC transporter permease [Bacillota bacterium]|nr:ABC transporter permease [Bacillota bacterium]
MWAIANIETQKQLQDKSLYFWTLILPIFFVVLFMELFAPDGTNLTVAASQIITGFSVFFSIFIIISMTFSFLKDKDSGLVSRLASTPLSSYEYFIGKWIPFIVIVLVQFIVLAITGGILYDMVIDNLLIYSITALLITLMVTAWGLAISVFSKTENVGLAVTQVVAVGGGMISGLWMPLETLPESLQTVGKLSPFYWGHQGLLATISDHPGGENVLISLSIIALYMVVGFVLAILGYRKFLKEARN